MSYIFRPPTVDEAPAGEGPLFYRYKLKRGKSVLKEGSSYRTVRYPTDVEVEAATVAYIGGYEYVITDTEAALLAAAGYGSNLTPGGGYEDLYLSEYFS